MRMGMESSKGVKKKCVVGIELNLMAVRKFLSRGVGDLVAFQAATDKLLTPQNRVRCTQQFASGIYLTNVTYSNAPVPKAARTTSRSIFFLLAVIQRSGQDGPAPQANAGSASFADVCCAASIAARVARICRDSFWAPHRPQQLITSLIEENCCTSSISSAQVSAVIGPTAGMLISRLTKQRTLDKFLALATGQRRSWRLPGG
jgi:hypothetical protein